MSAQRVTVVGRRGAVEDDPVCCMQLLQGNIFGLGGAEIGRHLIRVVGTHLQESEEGMHVDFDEPVIET